MDIRCVFGPCRHDCGINHGGARGNVLEVLPQRAEELATKYLYFDGGNQVYIRIIRSSERWKEVNHV